MAGNGTAGSTGDGGAATGAELNIFVGMAFDGAGNLYIGDNSNSRVRKVNAATGTITTVAGNGTAGRDTEGRPVIKETDESKRGLSKSGACRIYRVVEYNGKLDRRNQMSKEMSASVEGSTR